MQLATDRVRIAAMDWARRLGMFVQELHEGDQLMWRLWDHERKMYGRAILTLEAFSEKEPSEEKVAYAAVEAIEGAWKAINFEINRRTKPPNRDTIRNDDLLRYKFTGEKVRVVEVRPEHARLKGADGRDIVEAYEGLEWWT